MYFLLFSIEISLPTSSQKLLGEVEDLATETAETDVRLRNTFNEFLILADTQFIENVSEFICGHCVTIYLFIYIFAC